MIGRILCIDDEPARYQIFYPLAQSMGYVVTITDDPSMIGMFFQHPVASLPLIGVCLDHDMPHGDGVHIANRFLIDRTHPVAIVSSNPIGARKIKNLLDDFDVRCDLIPATSQGWESRTIAFFAEQQTNTDEKS